MCGLQDVLEGHLYICPEASGSPFPGRNSSLSFVEIGSLAPE